MASCSPVKSQLSQTHNQPVWCPWAQEAMEYNVLVKWNNRQWLSLRLCKSSQVTWMRTLRQHLSGHFLLGHFSQTPQPLRWTILNFMPYIGSDNCRESNFHVCNAFRTYFNSLNGGRIVLPLFGFVPPLKCVPPLILCGGLSLNL